MKKLTYIIYPEPKISVAYISGDVNIHDIIDLLENIVSDKLYDTRMPNIVDVRDANLSIEPDHIMTYIDHLNRNPHIPDKRLVAFLTTTPQQTALGFVYRMLVKHLPMSINVFTTADACLQWMNIPPVFIDKINDFINDQKT